MNKLMFITVIAGALSTTAYAQTQSTQQGTAGATGTTANMGSTNATAPGGTGSVADTTANTESSNMTAPSNTAGTAQNTATAGTAGTVAGSAGSSTAVGTTTNNVVPGTAGTATAASGTNVVDTTMGGTSTVSGTVSGGTATNVAQTEGTTAAGMSSVTAPAPSANMTVTAPGRGSGVATVTSPDSITYEQRAESAYRAANVPQDVIVKLRDYDVKIRDARTANDAALVRQYYSEQAGLLTPQQINGLTTYLRSNPVQSTTAVTVWEDPAYVSVASPATVTNPSTLVTREVRTQPVVTRQVQVPVAQGSVPVVVRDPVPVIRTEVSAPATIVVESTPAPTVQTTTEEVTTYTRIQSGSNTKKK